MLCSLFLWNDRFFSSWRNITCFDVDRCSLPSSGCSPTAQSASLGAQLAPGPCPTAVIALLPSPSYPSVTGMGWEGNVQVKFKFLPVAFLKGNLINLSKFPSGNTVFQDSSGRNTSYWCISHDSFYVCLSVYSSYSPSPWLSFLPFFLLTRHPLSLMKTHFRFSFQNGPPMIRSDIIWEPPQCFLQSLVFYRMFFMFSGTTELILAPFKYKLSYLVWLKPVDLSYEIVSFQDTICVIGLLICSINFYGARHHSKHVECITQHCKDPCLLELTFWWGEWGL